MLIVLTLLTASYFAAVVWVRRSIRSQRPAEPDTEPVELPTEDLPPPSAVGWPPGGTQFSAYVDDGFAALDAYLSEGFTA